MRRQSEFGDFLLVVYESKSDNVLTNEGVKLFEEFHNKITTNKDYPKFCWELTENECNFGMSPTEMFKSSIGDALIDYDAWIVNRLHVDDIAMRIPGIIAEAMPIEMMQGRFYQPYQCNYTCYTERMPTLKLTSG